MFYILGADHAQYGPATVEEVRQWIQDGRADGQTMGKMEGGEWTPLAHFPEFADLMGASAPPKSNTPPGAEEILARDYQIDIESGLSRGWKVLQANFWPLVGVTILTIVMTTVVNQIIELISRDSTREMFEKHELTVHGAILTLVASLLMMPFQTLFTAGLFKYCQKLVRGQQADVRDIFAGFGAPFVSLLLLGLAVGFVGLAGLGVGFVMWFQFGFSALSFVVWTLCLIATTYFGICFIFSVPLVIDREIGFAEAMRLSFVVVNRHWFWTFALSLVIGVVTAAGLIACCVGVLATIPLAYLMWMFVYEDIFGRRAA